MKREIKIIPPQWIIAGVFFAAIVIGALLLMIPFSTTANGDSLPLRPSSQPQVPPA